LNVDCVAFATGCTDGLPTPKPGKPLPERSTFILLAVDADARVLLQRRPTSGVWAGLWSLPEVDDDEGARSWFDSHLDGDPDDVEALAPIAHAFSHFRLQLRPLRWTGVAARTRVRDNPDLRWIEPGQLSSLGIPAPIRSLLQAQ
jgi:A/G-specific adenine glycosylase